MRSRTTSENNQILLYPVIVVDPNITTELNIYPSPEQ